MPLLKSIISAYEAVGDCQTLAALTCVLRMGEIAEMSPGVDEPSDLLPPPPSVAKTVRCVFLGVVWT